MNWLVKQGVADRARVAIMGGSYGGYATLVGLTFSDLVMCLLCGAVDIVGPSNIITLIKNFILRPIGRRCWRPLREADCGVCR